MELLYIYIKDDKRNIKGCEYNFSPNYRFSYQSKTKTFYMERCNSLYNGWFGQNITNITAIVGKNGSGKTNLLDCIIKSLCGQGGGFIFYKHEGRIYTNIPKQLSDYKFSFEVTQFNRFGSPLNSESDECISDTFVTYYSPTIDRNLSNRSSHYSKFKDISNSYILRQQLSRLADEPEYARMAEVDIMQTNDLFGLLLLFIYSHEQEQNTIFESIKLPEYFGLHLLYFSGEKPQHPTFKTLTQNLANRGFKNKLKKFLLTQIFLSKLDFPKEWNNETTFEEIQKSYGLNLFDTLCQLFDSGNINYNEPRFTGLRRGYYEFKCDIRINAINQEFINALYSYYNSIPMAHYASFGTMDRNVSNAQVNINLGISSGERAIYTFISRLLGVIWGKQGEIYHAAINKIKHSYRFDGKTIIILLDEPDLQLHPEWQQKFIHMLLKLLHIYFPKINFQIILTTHSPILLSDIPRTNVIFINKKQDGTCEVYEGDNFKETFASNIHTLYNNSFFLDGIPVGEFAKQKIELLHMRIEYGINDDYIIDDIYRIGEPIIRNVLLQEYDNKRRTLPSEKRIALLKEELKRLENDEQ